MATYWETQEEREMAPEHPAMTLIAAAASRLAGLVALGIGMLLALALASYDAADPSFFTATGRAAVNWLGEPGAMVADPLMRGLGVSAWAGIALTLVWGWRLALARGDERFWARLPALPMAVAAVAVFASLAAPRPDWPLSSGLGGLIGDRGARVLLNTVAMEHEAALIRLLPATGTAALVLAFLALGLTLSELRALARGIVARLGTAATAETPPAGTTRTRKTKANAQKTPPPEPSPPRRPGRLARAGMAAARGGLSALTDLFVQTRHALATRAPVETAPAPAARRAVEPTLRSLAVEEDILAAAPDPTVPPVRPGPAPTPRATPAPEPEIEDDEDVFSPIEDTPAAGPVVSPRKPLTIGRGARRREGGAQPTLFAADADGAPYEAPSLDLLRRPATATAPTENAEALSESARMLETVLDDYGVRGEITAVKPGPVVTLYELEPAPGLKASRVIGLADDIARSMSALSARIATVPGRSVIGIELPNETRETVWLRDTLESRPYAEARFPLALALGRDIEGEPVVANLAKMPHLLIAGTTGSGKSVAVNTMILSLLYRLSPRQCRLIMIDPKMLELSVYDDIPHLLAPVVTDPKKAVVALKWVVAEMEERYRRMSKLGVRNIDGYNARARDFIARGENFSRTVQTGFDETTGEPVYETQEFAPEEMPLIVVIVDEMADLMMVAGKEIEACIQRLAQMARASGIHLIMATQRPSVDVITGTIKANFPTRISFQVTSKIDSRTILGEQGAEQLLGQGDMLYMSGGGRIRRVHGPFVSDEEVEEVVRHLKALGTPDYVEAVTEGADDETASLVDEKLGLGASADGDDVLYDKAVAIVARDRKCSTSYIQRKLAIGYNKAARLVEQMEDQGVVSPANAVGKREILVAER